MALTATGFTGTVDNVAWAKLAADLGADYSVDGPGDFAVTAAQGLDRTSRVAPGGAYGHGVRALSDAEELVQHPIVASGTRWDLVCLRRSWTGSTVDVTSVTGDALEAIPAARNASPGLTDDQPLALVQLTAGQQVPTRVVDLRSWASKVLYVGTLQAITKPRLGMLAHRLTDRVDFRYERLGTGSDWVNLTEQARALIAAGDWDWGDVRRADGSATSEEGTAVSVAVPVVAGGRYLVVATMQHTASGRNGIRISLKDGNTQLEAITPESDNDIRDHSLSARFGATSSGMKNIRLTFQRTGGTQTIFAKVGCHVNVVRVR